MSNKTLFLLLLLLQLTHNVFSQDIADADTSRLLEGTIDSLVHTTFGPNYISGNFLDVDERITNAYYRIYQCLGLIFEDPHHQLEHSYIVPIYRCDDNGAASPDSSSIAIIRENKIIWHSKRLIHTDHLLGLPGFGDFNNDGTTDILCTTQKDELCFEEALWIISPDSLGGKLLNAVDEDGNSIIDGATDSFKFTRPKRKGPMVIEAMDHYNDNYMFVYTWNGSVFTYTKSVKRVTVY